ncbi:MAG: ribosome biogenesis GTPase Der [Proteobacteria bacterium]|nr:ribosome biogenesis GTPase Der [Pseudomonadota bacterium]
MKKVVIIGRPNVGKSSLFNVILRKRIAIVDDKPGITRDRNYAIVQYGGRYFYLIDTGGIIPDDEDDFSRSIVKQVDFALSEADVIIFITDVKEGNNPFDKDIANTLRNRDIPVIVTANKADNEERALESAEFHSLGFEDVYPVSCLHKIGINDLLDKVISYLPVTKPPTENKLSIAIVGKPNVGKSSYINKILKKERLIVSDIPGTTRDSIDTLIKYKNREIYIIDTAGIKHKSKFKEHIDYYMYLRAINSVEKANIVVLMMDASQKLTTQDKRIFNIIEKLGKPLIIVLNKTDLIPSEMRNQVRKYFQSELHFASYVPIVMISALEGRGIYKVLDMVLKIEYNLKKLDNETMRNILIDINNHVPFGLKFKKPVKLLSISQSKRKLNHFTLRFNKKFEIKDFQLKYIEKRIRKEFPFEGIPLIFYT